MSTSKRGRRANGEGSIYQRSDGRWTAAYYVPDRFGTRRRRYVYGASPEAVEEQLVKLRQNVKSGTPVAPAGLSLAEYLSEWLDQVAAPRVRASTLYGYRNSISRYLTPRLGRKKLGSLTARDVRGFLAELSRDGVGERTAQYAHSTLRAALEDAVREEMIPRNVAKLVRAPRPIKTEREPLNVSEIRTLLGAVKEHRLYALFVVVAVLGMRRSEILGLRWEDVDLAAGVLRIQRGLQRVDGALVTLPTKTRRSARVVPLPGFVVRALRDHQASQEVERKALGPRWPDLGFVFTTPIGTPIDPRNCTRMVQTAVQRAGLPLVRLHDFRHGCVSVLLALGVPPRTVMEIVGHSTLEMTMNVYAHVTLDDKREALDQLGELLDGEDQEDDDG
ncbi:site-specific integrase [Natronosporangium hydrolyticum]|uniref:Site-specific integrase n=1 Tax=Natronosporangium hydrolyticum TaxID=2811111 RepID=A0A895YBM5_9ACTN|nr:tyrosine-type recombinase/integrase [Natronosporangium hydrolyticum]QSB15167.1 site-specific integrase [Natronosporangium hydrolyticum]